MDLEQLPEIQINHHARATRLRLRVKPTGIHLTVPKYASKHQIQAFLTESTPWLITTWQKQQAYFEQIDSALPSELYLFNQPNTLKVNAQIQNVDYRWDKSTHELWLHSNRPITALKAFVMDYAQQYLPAYLSTVSHETGLVFKSCKIRQVKTRWGSCNSQHNIMLNSALVLCTEALVRYVCIHELAHTRHFNHSPAFWTEVHRHDINYLQHRKMMKAHALPKWYELANDTA